VKHSRNLFVLPDPLPQEELFETLIPDSCVRIERIVSSGQSTPAGSWLEQDDDEWVVLLQGKAVIEYPENIKAELEHGDWIFIPGHTRHRVAWTSSDPPCIWLAVHGRLRK
jgi:cupin 2 domain-containing protein